MRHHKFHWKKHHKWAAVATVFSALATTGVAVPVTNHYATSPSTCHIRGVLPDSTCTPGVADPNVTQSNLSSTICMPGYTKTVRPPVSVTAPEKIQSIKDYGYADTNTADYEYDHLISLELGGAPNDTRNLWAEPGASPNAKDSVENMLHKEVCNGTITLLQAQQEISQDWTTAK